MFITLLRSKGILLEAIMNPFKIISSIRSGSFLHLFHLYPIADQLSFGHNNVNNDSFFPNKCTVPQELGIYLYKPAGNKKLPKVAHMPPNTWTAHTQQENPVIRTSAFSWLHVSSWEGVEGANFALTLFISTPHHHLLGPT